MCVVMIRVAQPYLIFRSTCDVGHRDHLARHPPCAGRVARTADGDRGVDASSAFVPARRHGRPRHVRSTLVAVACLLCLACQRRSVAPAPIPPATTSFRFPAPPRLVAVGDLHGDWAAARAALRLAGASSDDGHWMGGGLVVVQMGDLIDRGDDDRRVLDWFADLAGEADRAGGHLYQLNGNHELMNVAGDLRYVTEPSLAAFADVSFVEPAPDSIERLPRVARGRLAAFLPGGRYARRLATHPCVILVGDTVFAHAGVRARDPNALARLNTDVSRWMRGEAAMPPEAQEQEGPLWTRRFGEASPEACAELDQVLAAVGARRMVVGHTVQENGIAPACDGRLFRVDVGLSRHRPGIPVQVLEIEGDKITVRTDS
jgi:hypothetical protein